MNKSLALIVVSPPCTKKESCPPQSTVDRITPCPHTFHLRGQWW